MSNEREPTFAVGQDVVCTTSYEEEAGECPTCHDGHLYKTVHLTLRGRVVNIFGTFYSDSVKYTYQMDNGVTAKESELRAA